MDNKTGRKKQTVCSLSPTTGYWHGEEGLRQGVALGVYADSIKRCEHTSCRVGERFELD